MQTKPFLVTVALGAVALVLASACSSGGEMSPPPGDDQLFVPAGLPNSSRDATPGGLTVVAFSLVQEAAAPAIYIAVRNDGEMPACNVGMMMDLLDADGYVLTSVGGGVWSKQYYRLDPDVILNCIDPGEIGMGASALPADLVIADVASLSHSFPGFLLQDIVHLAGITVSGVKAVTTGAGTTYTGKLTNGFEVAVSAATAAIFPVNRVGRPLGMATNSAAPDLPPGDSLTFATSAVADPGVGYQAYAGGIPAN